MHRISLGARLTVLDPYENRLLFYFRLFLSRDLFSSGVFGVGGSQLVGSLAFFSLRVSSSAPLSFFIIGLPSIFFVHQPSIIHEAHECYDNSSTQRLTAKEGKMHSYRDGSTGCGMWA